MYIYIYIHNTWRIRTYIHAHIHPRTHAGIHTYARAHADADMYGYMLSSTSAEHGMHTRTFTQIGLSRFMTMGIWVYIYIQSLLHLYILMYVFTHNIY